MLHPEAVDYLNTINGLDQPTKQGWERVLDAGDALLCAAGGVQEAAQWLWDARATHGLANLRGVEDPCLDKILHPDLLAYLRHVKRHGMEARHVGPRERATAGLHPNAKRNLEQVYAQIWKDVKKHRVLVASQDHPKLGNTMASPFEAVPKLLPDRSVSNEVRVVHDQRPVNQGTHKDFHPPALQPTHDQIARRVLFLKHRYPGCQVHIAKKDISGAFRLLWVAPADVELFAGDLPWKDAAMPDEEGHSGEVRGRPLTVLYLVSSFGFSGSPGEWTPWGRATEEFHRAHRPGLPRRDGALGFDCKILVDDAVLVEPLLGLRPWISAACYETGVKQMLGKEAVNREKDAIEGQFKEEQVIWGLTMNAASEKAFLPERRILRGSYLLGDSAFDAGEKCVTVRQVQQFRGITTGWAIVVRGLANELKAADIFLSNDEGGLPARPRKLGYKNELLEVEDAWEDLWSLFEVCRWLCARSDRWETHFGTTLKELLPVKERLSLPNEWKETVWVSSDATTQVIGAIDWTFGAAARATVTELEPWLMGVAEQEMQEDGDMRVHISEMLSLVAFVCERGPLWKGKVVLYAGDNSTVRQWVCKRQSGSRAGRLLVRVLNLCEMNYGFTLVGGWWRTFHNVDSDYITRCNTQEFEEMLVKKGWEKVELGPAISKAIEDTARFGPCFLSWQDPEDRQVMLQLKEKRLKRFVDKPLGIPWDKLRVIELASDDRWLKDFESLAPEGHSKIGRTRVVIVATLPVDEKGILVDKFIKEVSRLRPYVVIWEGPRCAPWEKALEGFRANGLGGVTFEFVSTELGEYLARRRQCLVGARFNLTEDIVKRCLVKTVTAPPLGAAVGRANQSKDLVWRKPFKMVIEPGVPRAPLLPQVVGHVWESPEGERKNVHGLAGPGRWPLRYNDGEFEVLEVFDRRGRPGHLRVLQPLEVWQCQGRSCEAWDELLHQGKTVQEIANQGNRATGLQVASNLLVMAGALVEFGEILEDDHNAGALGYEPYDLSMAKLLAWLRKWKWRHFGAGDLHGGDGRAGGDIHKRMVSRAGEALWVWCLEIESEENRDESETVETFRDTSAGGRRPKLTKPAHLPAGQHVLLEPRKVPFDGAIQTQVEEWLEENIAGSKATSTLRMYRSAWEKWEAWATRQRWPSCYLDVKGDKLANEDKLLAFLGYLGWLGSTAASIKQALFAVKDGHKRGGAGDPTEGMFRVWMLVTSLDRHAERKPRRLGVTPGMLLWIGRSLCNSDLFGEDQVDKAMVQAALLVAWFFMLRAKEYCDSGGVDAHMILRGMDVRLTKDGCDVKTGANEVTIQFRKTKADQEAFGSCKTMGATGELHLCPVRALEELREVAQRRFSPGPEAHLPLFRWGNGTTLRRTEVQAVLQKAARAEGLPEDRFMSHSLQIGGASALFQASGEIELVKRMGRWSSSAVQRYLYDGGEVLKELSGRMARVDKRIHYT